MSLVAATVVARAKEYRVTIGLADVDRAGLVVSFKLPPDSTANVAREPHQVLPLQVDADRMARFIVPYQKAGETRT